MYRNLHCSHTRCRCHNLDRKISCHPRSGLVVVVVVLVEFPMDCVVVAFVLTVAVEVCAVVG